MNYSDFSHKDEKENIENNNENNTKENIDKNDFGFKNIKNFHQLKNKVLEIKRDFEKTKIDVGDNTNNINLITNKLDQFTIKGVGSIGRDVKGEPQKIQMNENGNKDIESQMSEVNKKLKFLLGDINVEDIENEEKDENNKDKKKLMNFEEINRRLMKLQFTKVDSTELVSNNEKLTSKIDDVERKMNELIYGLYGEYINKDNKDTETHDKKSYAFVRLDVFETYKANTENELKKIFSEINNLKKVIELIFDQLKEKASLKDLDDLKNYLLEKVEELFMNLNKKFVEKDENE